MRKLSELQQAILKYVLNGNPECDWRTHYGRIGWGSRAFGGESGTRSEDAALSRALRRLVQRGLIVRGNDVSGKSNRTTFVELTDAGRVEAERLTKRHL
jgi:Winged helix DNA-binding domain